MSLLEVMDLHKAFAGRYDVRLRARRVTKAVRGVSFTQSSGETLALIGESGAGKSTTARLVARLIEPDAGRVLFDGRDLLALSRKEMRRERAKMQMVFQDPYSSLDPRRTIGASVSEPLRVHRSVPRSERSDLTASLLQRVGLSSSHMKRYPRELSGGQLQRAAIARALTVNPRLIICDEPVAALDILVRAQVLNLMKDLQDEFGIAYLFITHDLTIVRALADSVAIMDGGQIVEYGSPDEVYTAPKHPYTATLLNAGPSLIPKRLRDSSDSSDRHESAATSADHNGRPQ